MTTINYYDRFIEFAMDGGIDMDTDTWKIILMNATHVFTAANTAKATINANQLATANGYTQDAETLLSVTWTQPSAGTTRFDSADPSWTASGGDIGPATDAVIYSDTSTVPSADLLMCSIDFQASKTAGAGTDFLITVNASGYFEIS